VQLAGDGFKGIMRAMSAESAYQSLKSQGETLASLGALRALAWWDEETMMPAKGIEWRGRQLETVARLVHEMFLRPQTEEWIAICEDAGFPKGGAEAANVALWRREIDIARKLPADLIAEEAATASHARVDWAAARKASDFSAFLPWLEKSVELRRRRADFLGYEDHPYDALLDNYERGMRTRDLRALFARLRPKLVDLAARAADRAATMPSDLLAGDFPVDQQIAFNRKVAEDIGFDFDAGRIDTTTHPFCSRIAPGDVRMTTRYRTDDFTGSLFGILHESGHGLYEQGIPSDRFGTPVGASVSLGVHESQSRLWENHVGRSAAFWEKWLPVAAEHFPCLAKRTPEDALRALTRSRKGFIRVGADEATYDLHILLRFELELALIEGTLAPKDLPGEWNARFRDMLGLDVPDDARGCLQDIHWAMGAIGYFATYTLGNLNAAHLMEAARASDPALARASDQGDFQPLLGWMRERIHRHGSMLPPAELITRAAGSPMDESAFLRHIERTYVRD